MYGFNIYQLIRFISIVVLAHEPKLIKSGFNFVR